ncbi:MAG: hypothetical protein AABX47_06475 [Nanoarchaeota archaeon]
MVYGEDSSRCFGGLEEITELAKEVEYRPDPFMFSPRLLECSQRARKCLPGVQDSLVSAMESYQGVLAVRAHPYHPGRIVSRVCRWLSGGRAATIEELYSLQSRCFDYMLEIIDDVAAESGVQVARISAQRDTLADWLVRAGPAIAKAKRELRDRDISVRGRSLVKRVQHGNLMRSFRSDVVSIEQVEILYRSRQDLLPALEDYSRIAEDISHTVISLKAHAIAAAEYFEMTFEPARFLDSASDIMPCLKRGIEGMAGYHDALSRSISVCVDKLSGLKDAMGSSWRK